MKLSEETINILKNYSNINPTILVNAGNILKTVHPQKAILAKATVEESFPRQFAIDELPKFLGVLSLFKDPELEFGDKQLFIRSGRQSVSYTYAEPSMIITPGDKDIQFPTPDVEFMLGQEELNRLVRATGVLQLKNISVIGDGTTTKIAATNPDNPTADMFSIEVGETDKVFNLIFDVGNITKLISADYTVSLSSKGLSRFVSKDVLYYVAIEADSTFSG
jgi:hypothetical protein